MVTHSYPKPARLISLNQQRFSADALLPSQPSSAVGRILVVDDEQLNHAILSRLLRQRGFSVVEAESGARAIAVVAEQDFDLVLLDIVMPEMDGFAVLNILRKELTQSDLPVIMVTASAESEQVVRAFESGANDYIRKPVDVAVTMARINTHVKLKASQAALRQSEERYALAARGTNDGLWDWDLTTDQVYYSPRWASMLGIDTNAVSNSPDQWLDRVHPEDRNQVDSELQKHLADESPQFETELRMRHTDGSYRWMLCRGLAVNSPTGTPQRLAGSLTDITEGKVADALTGLPNRVLFRERLHRCTERRRRDPDYSFALLYLDLDNFKLINDSLGHDYGDRMLVSVARRLEGSVRVADSFISRLGGDEFAVLIENVATEECATAVAQRILDSVSAAISLGGGREVFASVSVGISISGNGKITTNMLQEADTAMYQAKGQGGSCFGVFDPVMKEDVTRRLDIEYELRRAVERNDFHVHYQPIVTVEGGRLVGFEALVRWNSPSLGMVSPGEFVPIAEDMGLIVPIGGWVLEEACRQMMEWKAAESRFQDVTINVNLSCRQLAQPGIVADISAVLARTGLDRAMLQLEVTEIAIIRNPEAGAALLAELRHCGVKVAIDDFGTGYSSLAYLHRLPLDALKIDRSFVDKMTLSEDNRAIVGTIITLADRLNLAVVAEGIETPEQRKLLQERGCEFAQAILFFSADPGRKRVDD